MSRRSHYRDKFSEKKMMVEIKFDVIKEDSGCASTTISPTTPTSTVRFDLHYTLK